MLTLLSITDSLLLATVSIVAAAMCCKTFTLMFLGLLSKQTGYGPEFLRIQYMPGIVMLILMFAVWTVGANPTTAALFKVNPTKNIPMLNDSNYHEWSWRISSAFIAIGMASSCLFLSQSSTEPKDEELESSDITDAKEAIREAEEVLDEADSAAKRKTAAERLQKAREALKLAIEEARDAYEQAVDTTNPFHGLDFSIQNNCFQLILKTVTPELDFLVMGFDPRRLQACWHNIRDYFQVNTRGTRNILKVQFFQLVMEPTMKFQVFKQKIEFAARQLNSMTPRTSITDDDKTTVLLHGLRKHHLEVFRTILDVLEQSPEELTFDDTCKRLMPTARRAEAEAVHSEAKESGFYTSSHVPCREYAVGKCFRLNCKYFHDPKLPKPPPCSFCDQPGHHVDKCWTKKKQEKKDNNNGKFIRHNEDNKNKNKDKALKAATRKIKYLSKKLSANTEEKAQVATDAPPTEYAFSAVSGPSADQSCQCSVLTKCLQSLLLLFTFFSSVVGIVSHLLSLSTTLVADRINSRNLKSPKATKPSRSSRRKWYSSRRSSPSSHKMCGENSRRFHKSKSNKSKSSTKTKTATFNRQSSENNLKDYVFLSVDHANPNKTKLCLLYIVFMFVVNIIIQCVLPDSYAFSETLLRCAVLSGGMTLLYSLVTFCCANEDATAMVATKAAGEGSLLTTIVDSGATSHLFACQQNFIQSTMKPQVTEIQVAGGRIIKSTHKGDVKLTTTLLNGERRTLLLKDALLVPSLTHNLVSLRRMDNAAYTAQIGKGKITLSSPNDMLVAVAHLKEGLYVLDTDRHTPSANLAATNTTDLPAIDLWHRRLGHASGKFLANFLSKSQRKEKLSYCDACVQAKMHRRPFFKTSTGTTNAVAQAAFDIVVSDLVGPMRTISHTGKRYVAFIIDVFTRYIWAIFLKSKDEFFNAYVIWSNFISRQTGKLPKRFHSDGGTEFHRSEFTDLFNEHGTEFTSTSPGSSNQNPIAERTNRTAFTMARSMLLQAGMPKKYWTDAIAYAVYVKNRLPAAVLKGRQPALMLKEVAKETAQTLCRHLHIFGCKAWKHDTAQGKLSAQAVLCVFLGVDTIKKGYRLLSLSDSKISISRNVVFDETSYPNQNNEPAQQPPSVTIELEPADDLPAREHPARQREPTGQSLRNIAGGDSAQLADIPELVSDSDSDSDSESESEICFQTKPTRKFFKKTTKIQDPEEPVSRSAALNMPTAERWAQAEREELAALEKQHTWEEVSTEELKGRQPITCKWVYKIKRNVDHTIERFKARLTARGFQQIPGVDYVDTFAAVAQLKSFRLLLAIAVTLQLKVTHIDFKNAFLMGNLKEQIFMTHPPGYPGPSNTVLKLVKSIYGLKQSPAVWFSTLFAVLQRIGFIRSGADPCVLFHQTLLIYIVNFVDDAAIATSNEEGRNYVLKCLANHFEFRDLGDISRYLGLQVFYDTRGWCYVHQQSYVQSVIQKFKMTDCKAAPTPATTDVLSKSQSPVTTSDIKAMSEKPYKNLVGSLWYAAHGTRVDIVYATNSVAQHAQNPGNAHWTACKRILRYLKDTTNLGISYKPSSDKIFDIIVYSDSDWGTNVDDRRSKTGYTVLVAGGAVVWQTKSQKTVALSSCEAELYAACEAVKEILWLIMFFTELKLKFRKPILYVDNQGAIALAKNPVLHQRTKHIDIRYFFIREKIDNQMFEMLYIETTRNLADLFTKPVILAVQRRLLKELMTPVPEITNTVEKCMLARVKYCHRNQRGHRTIITHGLQALRNRRLRADSRLASISRSRHFPPMVLPCMCSHFFPWNNNLGTWSQICNNCPLGHVLLAQCTCCGRQVGVNDPYTCYHCLNCNVPRVVRFSRRYTQPPNRFVPE